MITVSIADDHKMVVKSLSKLINESETAEVADVYYNLKSCRVGLACSLPDVLLLDIGMPDGDGVEFCAEIIKTYPKLRVIMLTSYKEFNVAKRALHSGALGYVLKNAEPEEIFAGIEKVSKGEQFLCEEIDVLLKNKAEEPIVWYSPREKEILQYIADGYTTKEIADKLFRDEETIKSYRKILLIKIVAKNAFEMVKKAIEQNLVRMTLLFLLLLTYRATFSTAIDNNVRNKQWYYSTDSLKQLLNQSLPLDKKIKIYYDIIETYGAFEQDTVIAYADKAKDIALKLNDLKTLNKLYIALGVAYSFNNNYDTALIYLDSARELAIKQKDKIIETNTVSLIAFTYAKQGKYNTAIDYYLKVLKMSENNGPADRYVMALTNLGEIYRRLGDTDTAIQYLKQAEEKCKLFDKLLYIWRMSNIYTQYAFNYLDMNDLDEALQYALKSDSLNTDGLVENSCYTKGLLATIYLQRNDYGKALQYIEKAFEQSNILKDKNLYAYTNKILSDINMAQKRYPEAEAAALKAWNTDSTFIDESRGAAENIVLANIYMNNTKKASDYFKKYSALYKQYSEKSFQTTVSDLSIKYETNKKELQISSLEKQRILYIIIGLVCLLLAIVVGVVSRQIVKREQLKKQLIATNAILEWEEKERKRFASELHDGINGMLSALKIELSATEHHVQNAGEKLDECIETIRRMSHGMMPASLERFGIKAALEDYCRLFPNVHTHFFGENKLIDKKVELMIYYCAYELVNNSVKHSGAENIDVQLVQSDKNVFLSIHDDGCGFDREAVMQGSGLKNINNRVISCSGKIDIVTSPGAGTETVIELKL